MWGYVLLILLVPGWLTYLIHHCVVAYFYKTQNLKKRYNATWALVTGGSSGIGKSIAFKLARQGLNVVLVALGDDLLESAHAELTAAFPHVQFRKVAAHLGKDAYMADLAEATKDITVQVVFCNAGYLLTGFFHTRTLDELMMNHHCNTTSAVTVSHHFLRKLVDAKLRGCFVYTSSAAASMPGPFAAQYAATKSYLSAFGASLASEVRPLGIDVLVFHPSPVASRFYDKTHKLDMLDFFKNFAVSPDDLPDTVFASIGRTVWRDIGPTAIGFRLMMKVIDYNFLAYIIVLFGRFMPDFKRQSAAGVAAPAAAPKPASARR